MFTDPPPTVRPITLGETLAIAFAIGWVILGGLFFWTWQPSGGVDLPGGNLQLIVVTIILLLPLAVVWVAVLTSRADRALREDVDELRDRADALRQRLQALDAFYALKTELPEPAKPEELKEQSGPTETAASRFASRREVSRLIIPRAAPQAPSDQPVLELDGDADDTPPPLDRADLIQALHFPNDENDTAGFAALRRALRDRDARRLVRASQDVLTLLAQDNLYMDHLRPDPVDADVWRSFAKGTRGRAIAGLGAMRDPEIAAQVATRLREDTVFREAVHQFLRRFDRMLVMFEGHATDTDLLELAETRTARAFMLLGRATGTFD